MTAGDTPGGISQWDWTQEGALEIGGTLMFARGSTPDQVIEAFGMDPGAARLLPASRVSEAVRLPAWDEITLEVLHPWIRAGQTGEWAFAVDESSAGYGGYEEQAARALSHGREVAWFSWTRGCLIPGSSCWRC